MSTEQTRSLSARPPHWLPLPFSRAAAEPEPEVDVQDLFAKGRIVHFYAHQGYGFLKSDRGEEIFFRLSELDLLGPKADKKYLRDGARVGFDASWTSKGLHVRYMKVY